MMQTMIMITTTITITIATTTLRIHPGVIAEAPNQIRTVETVHHTTTKLNNLSIFCMHLSGNSIEIAISHSIELSA